MAKKEKEKKEFSIEEAQNRMDKYVQACESEKKGKRTVVSIIGTAVLIFIILLIVILKMSGVGKTIVFSSDSNGNTTAYTDETAQGTTLADYVADKISEAAEK